MMHPQPCTQHSAEIAELQKNVEQLARRYADVMRRIQQDSAERRGFEDRIERANLELVAAVGTLPDPINGSPGTGLRGYVYNQVQARQAFISQPELAEHTRDDLVQRTKNAESLARASHTKLVVTLIGAFIGGIISAITAVLAALK